MLTQTHTNTQNLHFETFMLPYEIWRAKWVSKATGKAKHGGEGPPDVPAVIQTGFLGKIKISPLTKHRGYGVKHLTACSQSKIHQS